MSCRSLVHAATSTEHRDVVKGVKCQKQYSRIEVCCTDLCRAAVAPVMMQLKEYSLLVHVCIKAMSKSVITGQSCAMLAQH